MLDTIIAINGAINSVVWGVPMMVLIVGGGIFLTIRMGFFQFRKFGHAMKNTIGKCFGKNAQKESAAGSVTPLQAVTTALAATVGTGNIVGVTGAIALGGPGAVFWMELSALVGMITKFCEVTLSIKYRERNAMGDWVGGPMYYIKNGLGPKWKWLGMLFAGLGALAAFGIGNLTQVNSIATSLTSAVNTVIPSSVNYNFAICLGAGILVCCVCLLTYLGGIKRIGSVNEKLVPVMAIIYILASLTVIILNIGRLPSVLSSIFVGAFNPTAVCGGVVGITVAQAMQRGVSRGVFSNEAGLGSAPIAHAAADTKGPIQQGLFGIFEVFADTIVICTMTALVILMSGTPITYGQSAGVELTNAAFAQVFGPGASIVVCIGLVLFAGSTILSWGLYGTRCVEFLFGPKVIKPYQLLFCLLVVVGSVTELSVAWAIADTLNALMAIPNLIGVLALSPVVYKLLKEYREETFALRK
ncbi:MAG: sodium:alanine symporter family protein [Oscillospiraceae bacterium]